MAEAAYWAGFVDGEGHIGIARHGKGRGYRYHVLTVTVANCEPAVLMQAQIEWGGTVAHHQRANPNHRPVYSWVVTSRAAERFLRAIQPYVIVKRQQLEIALAFMENGQFDKRRRTRGIPDEALTIRDEYRWRLHALNSHQGGADRKPTPDERSA